MLVGHDSYAAISLFKWNNVATQGFKKVGYQLIKRKQYLLLGTQNTMVEVQSIIKDVFAKNCHTFFLVTSNGYAYRLVLDMQDLRKSRKTKLNNCRIGQPVQDLRNMVVHKESGKTLL